MNREERKEQARKDQTHYFGVGSLGKGSVRKSQSREVLREAYKQKYLPSFSGAEKKIQKLEDSQNSSLNQY